MTDEIPENFLRAPVPKATLHILDFEHTSPPIPLYKGHFAAVVENLLTETECKELIRLAEESTRIKLADSTLSPPAWEQAMINAGGGRQVLSVDTRKSGRIILDSHDLSGRILDRIMPFIQQCKIDCIQNKPLITGLRPAKAGEVFHLSRLNERLRFLRYEGGDYFRPHWDGRFVTPDELESSLFTIHLYLNGDGEQDMEELQPHIERAEKSNLLFVNSWEIDLAENEPEEAQVGDGNEALLGGATSFMAGMNSKESVRVFPKTGSALIFQQRNLFHGGDDVFRGVKYTLRTDVMYTTE
ncbi:Prolyl 4-hydroxylase alpha subunit [Penicillium vulpinum]|uniref:Prolyl 4-hydroxylase alpha subunit domain-containing protein n=1 Tax=Penicillium vulpinum TaxID=29845 RepID=A0A1V6SCS6_9EURO|nr:Prolyl 4-hydroxylase alpha subunit [Penicillium vulpinum]KAJ5964476.1 Prolyl 4-hydroxylase alpha subunit [Penicillium vulpinum]OQE11835.1 hypothetical protein PENVUL_c002G08288 [Penicillium vulpinum]